MNEEEKAIKELSKEAFGDVLTPECAITTTMYAIGLSRKEIASKKVRSYHTIREQVRTAMEILEVSNGRELAVKLCERISGIELFHLTEELRKKILSLLLLCVFSYGMTDMQAFTRTKTRARARTSIVVRARRDNNY